MGHPASKYSCWPYTPAGHWVVLIRRSPTAFGLVRSLPIPIHPVPPPRLTNYGFLMASFLPRQVYAR